MDTFIKTIYIIKCIYKHNWNAEITVPLTYNDSQRRAYLDFTDQVASGWVHLFAGDTTFYNAAYWDLFKHLWRTPEPVRKTDAANAITGVKSPLTASKYIETALARGMIIEKENPRDARSKLLALSPQMRAQMDVFFDDAVDSLRKSAAGLKDLGPVSD